MTKLLNKLKLWQKLALIISSFALPIGVLAYFTFQSFQDDIQLAHQELAGDAFNRPLTELMRDLAAHQLLLQRYYNGEKELESEIVARQAKIDTTFSTLEQAQHRFGAQLLFTTADLESAGLGQLSPEKMRSEWQAIVNGWPQSTPEHSQQQHEHLTANVMTMIERIVDDASDLSLDPGLDSSHLLTVTFEVVPAAQLHINQIGERGLRALVETAPANQVALASETALLREIDTPRLTNEIEAAVRNDAKSLGVSEGLQHDVPPRLAEFKKASDALLSLSNEIVAGKSVDHAKFTAAVDQATNAISQLSQTATDELDHLIQVRLKHFEEQRLIAIVLCAGALLLAALLAWVVARNVTGRLRKLSDAAQATAAQGDLSHEIETDGSDEIGTLGSAFSQMVAHLRKLTSQVQKSAMAVNSSVTEIAATSKQQQATTSEVAATTTEIGATSKEISATSRELVKTMSEVSGIAEATSALANSGQSNLDRMEQTMEHFVEAVGAINSKLAVLSEKAGNINQVIATITKVADQTNLLSLNAAIEAEKAGEYGRGFAVVATEIRRLADQTAVATFDIEQMVKEMQSAVAAGVMGMDKFGEQVRRGVQEVQQVGSQLAQIINQVQTLSPRFTAVDEGMQAQALGADQITQALSQLSEATQQTADSLRQSNISIELLHDASRGMLTSLDGFKLRTA
ncbi:methyl-accepting chemotaxis sensory transducer [Chthoniobacter flavus Ellin428]|uniref:Methyl-accepting chemotaxis sensory transducer n=1 Tax=Chthoniobacter flavus Ellin428 TaxID=497964 RepID=B4D1N3_9BACT|nr:methyl-accepting chemotaxis protein [Chthoniobacter flavus]EDY19645.1 methyl-accepting chemotaxis sensory transducer [Chthoniobacter flavus Ellin428]TCO92882.1 methyl-accepting chemotaxis protein [Chthoniobacter flavus]